MGGSTFEDEGSTDAFAKRNRPLFMVQDSGCGFQGSGFGVQGVGFRVQGQGYKGQDSGWKVQGFGLRVWGGRLRVQGLGLRVEGREAAPARSSRQTLHGASAKRSRRTARSYCSLRCPALCRSGIGFRIQGLGFGV